MSIQRVDKFDIQKLATAQTVAEAKASLNKIFLGGVNYELSISLSSQGVLIL